MLLTCVLSAAIQLLVGCQKAVSESIIHTTALGEHTQVQLADGIDFTLNTSTRVIASLEGTTHVLDMQEGEMLLNVSGGSRGRSLLRVGDLELEPTAAQVRVLARRDVDGARRIQMISGEGVVRILQTRVGISSRSGFLPVVLTAGEALRARGNVLMKESVDRATLDGHLAWLNGEVFLQGESLADAAAEFNRYNSRKLVISDGAISSLSIGGRFNATDVDAFVKSLQKAFGIRVVIDPAATRDRRAAQGDQPTIVLAGRRERRT